MPTYKLTYFDITGRAESTRLVFQIAGIPFQDERLERTEISSRKDSFPFGQVPVLTIDNNFVLAQSDAILRYIGALYGLYPTKDPMEAAKVDMMLGVANDIGEAIISVVHENDESRKAQAQETLLKEKLPKIYGYLDRYLSSNGSASGYCVGEKLTVADLQMYLVLSWAIQTFGGVPQDLVNKYERISRLYEIVDKNEKVASWNKEHQK